MLDQAEEMSVIEKLLKGIFKDFYLATAATLKEVLNIIIERKQAKDTSLALAYGKGNEALARDFGYIPTNPTPQEIDSGKKEAGKFKSKFFSALPSLYKLVKILQRSVKHYGRIHNPFGRVMYFEKDEGYKALNGYVQGGAADITKKAMVDVVEMFKNNPVGEIVLPLIKKAMVEAYEKKHIGLEVEFEYSPINKYGFSSWGEKILYEEMEI